MLGQVGVASIGRIGSLSELSWVHSNTAYSPWVGLEQGDMRLEECGHLEGKEDGTEQ
jgi:hypothetical protein